jgi:SAM-dependent methyltransferase
VKELNKQEPSINNKQVDKDHYRFSAYINKARWCSVWHQLDEVMSVKPKNMLEVGVGSGLFKAVAKNFGLDVKTLDIAEDLNPDIVSSATNIPFENDSIDTICCFQMLEHLPFELSLEALKEFNRVAKHNIIISLPDAKVAWPFSIYIPKIGKLNFHIHKPFQKIKKHVFDGEHHWEINKLGYELPVVQYKLAIVLSKFKLVKTYRVQENPYHRFFIYTAKN